MEEIISNQQSRYRESSISLHHSSHTISKLKPKVRVVHLIAPEIIKTDVTNFRDLVQKLTGKPTTNKKRSKSSGNTNPKSNQERGVSDDNVKEEQFVKYEDQWINMEGSSSGGYLSYLEEEEGEVEGFFQPSFMGDLSSLFHVSS
jgi:VQ motif